MAERSAPAARWTTCAPGPTAAPWGSSRSSSGSLEKTRRGSWSRSWMPDAPLPDPGLLHLLLPKYLTAKSRALAGERGRAARWVVLGVFGLGFWAFIFTMVF